MSCAQAKGLPWLAPCCSGCGGRARAAGDVATIPSSSSSTSSSGAAGYGALLVLGGIFVAVVYGEKVLRSLGG